jgi:hypothetical protein
MISLSPWTNTAPTIGLGEVLPRPRAASSNARSITDCLTPPAFSETSAISKDFILCFIYFQKAYLPSSS